MTAAPIGWASSPTSSCSGTLGDVGEYVKEHGTDVIFIALPIRHVKRVMNLLDDLRDTTASIYYVPDIFVFDLIQARSGEIHGHSGGRDVRDAVLRLPRRRQAPDRHRACRSVILLLLLPLLRDRRRPGEALLAGTDHIQAAPLRPGRPGNRGLQVPHHDGDRGRRADPPGVRRPTAASRRIGALLRRSSLDEMPQLINVLQGRMSLVGPRPHAVAHNEEYRKLIKGYMVRHKVLPGITGLAQVNGCRGETSQLEEMEARVNFDLDYLRHWSPMLDIKIICSRSSRCFATKRPIEGVARARARTAAETNSSWNRKRPRSAAGAVACAAGAGRSMRESGGSAARRRRPAGSPIGDASRTDPRNSSARR